MVESLLREWNGETVIVRFDKPTGAWISIAIHSTRLGPAAGGTRMKSYPDAQVALKGWKGAGEYGAFRSH